MTGDHLKDTTLERQHVVDLCSPTNVIDRQPVVMLTIPMSAFLYLGRYVTGTAVLVVRTRKG